ncbi:hypothetical protein M378DRAFT_172091 [Amanita muscaria Koide BX008]|uniref:Uncharacterized protein n=1 Tax=Amanita muscaria (strain Koide BX008) TaxID=946122 RepID=A0A0C2SSY9_AMAMK|nr:hypothetical protein M378DRAFT_172091 [Amanita muscaria Koide BX008]
MVKEDLERNERLRAEAELHATRAEEMAKQHLDVVAEHCPSSQGEGTVTDLMQVDDHVLPRAEEPHPPPLLRKPQTPTVCLYANNNTCGQSDRDASPATFCSSPSDSRLKTPPHGHKTIGNGSSVDHASSLLQDAFAVPPPMRFLAPKGGAGGPQLRIVHQSVEGPNSRPVSVISQHSGTDSSNARSSPTRSPRMQQCPRSPFIGVPAQIAPRVRSPKASGVMARSSPSIITCAKPTSSSKTIGVREKRNNTRLNEAEDSDLESNQSSVRSLSSCRSRTSSVSQATEKARKQSIDLNNLGGDDDDAGDTLNRLTTVENKLDVLISEFRHIQGPARSCGQRRAPPGRFKPAPARIVDARRRVLLVRRYT